MNLIKIFPALFLSGLVCSGPAAQAADAFQADVPPELVTRVDIAKEKQVTGSDLGAAENDLLGVLKAKPDYYRAQYNLGLIYQSQGKTDLAIETIEKAMKLRDEKNIEDNSILNTLGWLYMGAGRLDDAEKTFLDAWKKKAANSDISNQRLLNNLGYLYLQKGDPDAARNYLQIAIKEYRSSGAVKVLKLVDDFAKRAKASEDWVVEAGFGTGFSTDSLAEVQKRVATFQAVPEAKNISTMIIRRGGQYFLTLGGFPDRATADKLLAQLKDGNDPLGKGIKGSNLFGKNPLPPPLKVVRISETFWPLQKGSDGVYFVP